MRALENPYKLGVDAVWKRQRRTKARNDELFTVKFSPCDSLSPRTFYLFYRDSSHDSPFFIRGKPPRALLSRARRQLRFCLTARLSPSSAKVNERNMNDGTGVIQREHEGHSSSAMPWISALCVTTKYKMLALGALILILQFGAATQALGSAAATVHGVIWHQPRAIKPLHNLVEQRILKSYHDLDASESDFQYVFGKHHNGNMEKALKALVVSQLASSISATQNGYLSDEGDRAIEQSRTLVKKGMNLQDHRKNASKSQKRAAVCIFGPLRYLDVTMPWMQQNLVAANPDWHISFFLVTYTHVDEAGGVRDTHDVGVDKGIDAYNPVGYKIYGIRKSHGSWSSWAHRHHIQINNFAECNALIVDYQNRFEFKFDLVLRLRPGLIFSTPVNLTKYERCGQCKTGKCFCGLPEHRLGPRDDKWSSYVHVTRQLWTEYRQLPLSIMSKGAFLDQYFVYSTDLSAVFAHLSKLRNPHDTFEAVLWSILIAVDAEIAVQPGHTMPGASHSLPSHLTLDQAAQTGMFQTGIRSADWCLHVELLNYGIELRHCLKEARQVCCPEVEKTVRNDPRCVTDPSHEPVCAKLMWDCMITNDTCILREYKRCPVARYSSLSRLLNISHG